MNNEKTLAAQILKDFSIENFNKLHFHSFFSGCGAITFKDDDGRSYCIGFYKGLGDNVTEAFSPFAKTFAKQAPCSHDKFWMGKIYNGRETYDFGDKDITAILRNRFYLLQEMNQNRFLA